MKVKVLYRGQLKELHFDKEKVQAVDVLRALGLSPDYAFVVRGEEILQESQSVKDGEELRVFNAISGGR